MKVDPEWGILGMTTSQGMSKHSVLRAIIFMFRVYFVYFDGKQREIF